MVGQSLRTCMLKVSVLMTRTVSPNRGCRAESDMNAVWLSPGEREVTLTKGTRVEVIAVWEATVVVILSNEGVNSCVTTESTNFLAPYP